MYKFDKIWSINPRVYTLEYVQQASIITGVSFTTFARGDAAKSALPMNCELVVFTLKTCHDG